MSALRPKLPWRHRTGFSLSFKSPVARRVGWLARHPAWPISALLIGYPIWWALGLADFTWFLSAIPALGALRHGAAHGRRIRVPPGFGLWLGSSFAPLRGYSSSTLTAPGTVQSPVFGPSPLLREPLAQLHRPHRPSPVRGQPDRERLPRRRFAWMLGLLAIYTMIGGLAGMADRHFQFASPFLYLLPKSAQANLFIQASMHPGLAQIQNVIGSGNARPKAPYDYTNLWGECLTILAPFLIAAWWTGGRRRQRVVAGVAIVLALVPFLYSLNRGAWVGAGVAVVYLAVRLARMGKTAVFRALLIVTAVGLVVLVATPAHNVITDRLANGKSNTLRGNLSGIAVQDAIASPILGYGDTRQERGSPGSIAVGPSPTCPSCGQQAVGSNGQLYLLLVTNGFLGTFFFLAFFAYGLWRFRRDRSAYGLAGELVLLLSFIYMFAYVAVGAPFGFTMLVYALLWKSDRYAQEAPVTPIAPQADTRRRSYLMGWWRDLKVTPEIQGDLSRPASRRRALDCPHIGAQRRDSGGYSRRRWRWPCDEITGAAAATRT